MCMRWKYTYKGINYFGCCILHEYIVVTCEPPAVCIFRDVSFYLYRSSPNYLLKMNNFN